MIRIRNLSLHPGEPEQKLRALAARELRVRLNEIAAIKLFRRSIDARRKPDVRLQYTVDITLRSGEAAVLRRYRGSKAQAVTEEPYSPPVTDRCPASRPVVVGFGPGGMFAALVLAKAGLRPIVLERGDDADTRRRKVETFFQGGPLDPESNVQFGEGGAGTFSDGKLNTGTHDIRISWVLQQLAEAGAGQDILVDAKPHIGTDVLQQVVKNLRAEICALGGEVHFRSPMTELELKDGCLQAVLCGTRRLPCCGAILALGHSARDSFELLHAHGLPMEPKPFSMGVRIEHSQAAISRSQYGESAGLLPPADYKLAVHLPDGESAYTFCMCPGGYVVAAASENGGLVTNGMSNAARDGENANAALLVTLTPEDFPPGDSPLRGMYWQRQLEQAAFRAGGGNYCAPCQSVGSFLTGSKPYLPEGCVPPTYRPGVKPADLRQVLPEKIWRTLAAALPALDRQLQGFADPHAVLTAPETRSSSPVRILRDKQLQSPAARHLFPCGEGAGYAGGIVSAAVDGIRCAEALIASLQNEV